MAKGQWPFWQKRRAAYPCRHPSIHVGKGLPTYAATSRRPGDLFRIQPVAVFLQQVLDFHLPEAYEGFLLLQGIPAET
jgi:hypothetical protein